MYKNIIQCVIKYNIKMLSYCAQIICSLLLFKKICVICNYIKGSVGSPPPTGLFEVF